MWDEGGGGVLVGVREIREYLGSAYSPHLLSGDPS